MANPPLTDEELIARFGPHLNVAPPGGWNADLEVDREVKTHCCFCGQQCGIILKVHENAVVGFEPWYEFPFNEGKLCPKGVKRYLQGSHPDRLLEPLVRTDHGFAPESWDAASQVTPNRFQAAAASAPDGTGLGPRTGRSRGRICRKAASETAP